ncbi:MAG: 4Fe-4S ferredoxin, partial [Alphaproteobacteria bacterium]|nr:4Fe-4S ferredoxin [Alphaproteobacteria bacterium]
MPLDAAALARGCRNFDIITGRQFCRAELDRFRALARSGAPLTVGCTQEAPLFREVTEDGGADLRFVNLRETAGWSADAAAAGPKMAALAAAGTEPMPEIPFIRLDSAGVLLVYGRDERAIEAASLLKEHLDVTVLLTQPDQVVPPRTADFPVAKGTIRTAKGHLGSFELVVDDYATPRPSSRSALVFGASRNGATSRCDIVLDLSG